MTVSSEERESLHYVLDALLNARLSMEKVDVSRLAREQIYRVWLQPRGDLFRDASIFLRRVLGQKLHHEEMRSLFETRLVEDAAGAELAATIANAFRSFLPLFMRHAKYELDGSEVIEHIISDLMGQYWGDVPRFSSPAPGRQGLHKRPYRLARLRLSALDWDKFLALVGVPTYERHAFIVRAYRTEWEAIRKWAVSIEEKFDLHSYPPRYPEYAQSQFDTDPQAIWSSIQRDGDAYWLERGTAQSGRER